MTNTYGLSGKVITVLGEIAPEELGFTHPHEHIFSDLSVYFVEPADEKIRQLAHEPVSLKNLYWVRYHWRESLDCQRLLDEGVAIDELNRFKAAGGKTIMDALSGAGAILNRVVMGHMDRCGYELDTRLKLLETGCYIEYDVFGKEGYYPAEAALADGHLPDMPNDVGRIRQIKELIDLGYLKQILISQDTCMKIDLTRWGGPGYAHILENVIPLMRVYGMTEEQIRTLTVENPKVMLSIP